MLQKATRIQAAAFLFVYLLAAKSTLAQVDRRLEDAAFGPLLGTVDVTFREVRSAGMLSACEFQYGTVVQDFRYRNGRYSTLMTTFSLNYAKGKQLFGILKIKGADMEVRGGAPAMSGEFEIPYAYAQAAGTNLARREFMSNRCDGGGHCAGYEMSEIVSILNGIFESDLKIGYNRSPNGLDVEYELNLNAPRVNKNGVGQLQRCVVAIMERFEKQD